MQLCCKKIKANLLRFAIFVCFLFLLCICFVNCFGHFFFMQQAKAQKNKKSTCCRDCFASVATGNSVALISQKLLNFGVEQVLFCFSILGGLFFYAASVAAVSLKLTAATDKK
jgi:hypothetical protein